MLPPPVAQLCSTAFICTGSQTDFTGEAEAEFKYEEQLIPAVLFLLISS